MTCETFSSLVQNQMMPYLDVWAVPQVGGPTGGELVKPENQEHFNHLDGQEKQIKFSEYQLTIAVKYQSLNRIKSRRFSLGP